MPAYSLDLRQRVVDAYNQQQGTAKQVAALFGISMRTLQRYLKQYRQEGTLEPKPQNSGRRTAFDSVLLVELDGFVQQNSDVTLERIQTHFADRVECSIPTIHNTLRRLGWVYKKNRYERVSKIGPI